MLQNDAFSLSLHSHLLLRIPHHPYSFLSLPSPKSLTNVRPTPCPLTSQGRDTAETYPTVSIQSLPQHIVSPTYSHLHSLSLSLDTLFLYPDHLRIPSNTHTSTTIYSLCCYTHTQLFKHVFILHHILTHHLYTFSKAHLPHPYSCRLFLKNTPIFEGYGGVQRVI